ncbi:MAG: hypothetical protein IKB07_00320 [Lachnospiraceae bacterium]|nr:hypothetical protein [Lachnospiraceae bacterium]
MIQLEDAKFYTLLKFFFSDFFCDYLEEAIEDDEKSVVTLFRGMEFFLDLIKEQKISFPYTNIEEYVTQTYADGKEIYEKMITKYEQELIEYRNKEKSFEEIYGNLDFF